MGYSITAGIASAPVPTVYFILPLLLLRMPRLSWRACPRNLPLLRLLRPRLARFFCRARVACQMLVREFGILTVRYVEQTKLELNA